MLDFSSMLTIRFKLSTRIKLQKRHFRIVACNFGLEIALRPSPLLVSRLSVATTDLATSMYRIAFASGTFFSLSEILFLKHAKNNGVYPYVLCVGYVHIFGLSNSIGKF